MFFHDTLAMDNLQARSDCSSAQQRHRTQHPRLLVWRAWAGACCATLCLHADQSSPAPTQL